MMMMMMMMMMLLRLLLLPTAPTINASNVCFYIFVVVGAVHHKYLYTNSSLDEMS